MLARSLLGCVLAAISLVEAAVLPLDGSGDDVVDLGYVKYLGNRTYSDTVAFLGIPYAEAPIGDRRFRAPAPLNTDRIAAESNGEVVDARAYANFCIQHTATGQVDGSGTEDCLKVNIWAPVGSKSGDNLPVLFYIHGGGYRFGHPNILQFDHWVHQSPNVVIVSVGYRLGLFGFLSTPSFKDSSLGDFNVGLKDQIQALRWVKDYISFFGGDPNKVTINGQSAGGSSVELQLLAQKDEPLFHGAIGQSVWRAPMATPEDYKPLFDFVTSHVGCAEGDDASTMACLRGATAQQIAAAHDDIGNSFKGPYNAAIPTLDGELFTEYPTQSFLAGRFAKVPLIVGGTTNDSVFHGDIRTSMQSQWPQLTNEDIDEISALYPESDYPDAQARVTALTADALFLCTRTEMANTYYNQPASWTYRYNQQNPKSIWPQKPGQVSHSAENWMMFRGTVGLDFKGEFIVTGLDPIQTAFSEELIAYWLSFVRSGDPNTYKLPRSPTWSPFTPSDTARIVLQQDPSNSTTQSGIFLEAETQKQAKICDLLHSKWKRFQH